jgi:two-component system, sensor histidine kinase LadS
MNKPKQTAGGQNQEPFKQGSMSFCPPMTVAQTPEVRDLQGKRVLIVDDDPVFAEATAMGLRSANCRVTTAEGSTKAIAALVGQSFDAVLLDINFSGTLDGFQMLKGLRALRAGRQARFIMVSNSASASDLERAEELRISHYFQKPVNFARLLSVLAGGE